MQKISGANDRPFLVLSRRKTPIGYNADMESLKPIYAAAQSQFCRDFPDSAFQFCTPVVPESHRWIVRVFYRPSETSLPPSIAKLYEVMRDGSSAKLLSDSEAANYENLPRIMRGDQ